MIELGQMGVVDDQGDVCIEKEIFNELFGFLNKVFCLFFRSWSVSQTYR